MLVPIPTAQAEQDILVQQRGGQLVTGLADRDEGEFTIGAGQQVFTRQGLIRVGDTLATDEPGFNSVQNPSGEPAASPLPGNQPLDFVIQPMTIGGLTGTLFFWSGESGNTPADVAFQPVAAGLQLKISSGAKNVIVDGTNAITPGFTIDQTAANGDLHSHMEFEIEQNGGAPADGFYLFAMSLKMPGLADSAPVYLALSPMNPYEFEVPPSPFFDFVNYWDPREVAVGDWITENLVAQPGLCGDLDRDQDVDSADLLSFLEQWTGALEPGQGTSTFEQGDCDRDGDVDAADTLTFLANWTGAPAGRTVATVPEPGSSLLLAGGLASLGFVSIRRGRGRQRRKSGE
ncbi:MAG: PEP-CTERM sorting domain-containing protein [Pirellulales bacterium]